MTALLLCLAMASTHPLPVALRGCTLAPAAVKAGECYGVDPALLLAIAWVESRWKPGLVSSAGACSYWQTLPRYSNATCAALNDPWVSADAAAYIFTRWLRRGGTVRKALQGYVCGGRGLSGACGVGYAARVLRIQEGLR